ncbi:MAG: hypothetical protein WAK82_08935 [Streptosporangiaceae bacterium]
MSTCITCGRELHPDRAKKYNYCMSRECQEKNAKPLTMVAVGVNKAAEQYMLLDEQTKDELASGKYHDQRRGSFGTSLASPAPAAPAPAAAAPAPAPAQRRAPRPAKAAPAPVNRTTRQPWTRSQEKLALLYHEQGMTPNQIADKLRLSTYLVTQILLNSLSRGKL